MDIQKYLQVVKPIYPCFIYGVFSNPNYGQPVVVDRPSREEWETLRGYEPMKMKLDYEDWADAYVESETRSRKIINTCPLTVLRFVIEHANDPLIKMTESRADFNRWIVRPTKIDLCAEAV